MKIKGTDIQVGDRVQVKLVGYAPRIPMYVRQLGPTPDSPHMFQREGVKPEGRPDAEQDWPWVSLPDEHEQIESIEVTGRRPEPEMKVHPAADIFPHMGRNDFHDLCQDIEENGLLEPIITLDGAILDGRHRYLACRSMGVESRFEEYTGGNPVQYVMSKNRLRRDLTPTARLMIATHPLVVERERERAKARKGQRLRVPMEAPRDKHGNEVIRHGDPDYLAQKLGDVRDILADAAGLGHGLVDKTLKLRELAKTNPRAAEAVAGMEGGIYHHKDVFRKFFPRPKPAEKTVGQIKDAAAAKAVQATRTPKLSKAKRNEARLDVAIQVLNELEKPATDADRVKVETIRLALDVWAGPAESGGTSRRKSRALRAV